MYRGIAVLAGTALLLGVLATVGPAAETVRPPAHAGRFYPASARELERTIAALLAQAEAAPSPERPPGRLRALVMPHAGYVFSGLTAAHALRLVAPGQFHKVVMVGPDHGVGIRDGAVSDAGAWQTPLGTVLLHPDAARLRRSPLFCASPASDRREHSLEVLLPLLQQRLDRFRIVPVVIGPCDVDRIAGALAAILTPETLVVVSSDLSHGLARERVEAYDRRTLRLLLDLDGGALLDRENCACGKWPLAVLTTIARQRGWRPVRLHYSHSGQSPYGRDDWIVGYGAVAFYGEDDMQANATADNPAPIDAAQGQLLVRLARQTIAERLGRPVTAPDAAAAAAADPALQRPSGTFVTLKIDGQLRGCIGSLAASEPLAEGVRRNAVNAAFHDFRFAPLTAAEFDRITVEVSVLTPPEPLAYTDGEDLLRRIEPHVHGLIIRQGRAQATFLPQVWEQLPRPEEFLSHLCRKAGLAGDAWRSGRLEVETYRVVYFEEHD